jgi:hypothetical protein
MGISANDEAGEELRKILLVDASWEADVRALISRIRRRELFIRRFLAGAYEEN